MADTGHIQEPSPGNGPETAAGRARRLETAGLIAGQIAHDFNNLLTPLLAYPAIIRQSLPAGSKAAEMLGVMERTAQDMAHITRQLLVLGRRGSEPHELFILNDVTRQAIDILRGDDLPAGVEIRTGLAPDLLPVRGAREQMLRLIENLGRNALDAISDRGVLEIGTENVYLDGPVGEGEPAAIGEYVKLTVSDTGAGIPEEIRDRIFDPFFTTKRAAKKRGSGLGLSVVHGVLRDHRGLLKLESAVGKGTTFTLYFPVCREDTALGASHVRGGSERILVVDDDPTQRRLMTDLLAVLGYQASALGDGAEALALFEPGAGEPPDLVLLDVVLETGMSGPDTCREILRRRPGLRVLPVSGHAPVRVSRLLGEIGLMEYLAKPVTLESLGAAVRLALDSPAPAPVPAEPPEPAESPGREGPIACRPRTVLVVDDEPGVRSLFATVLSSAMPDIEVESVANGLEAFNAFRRKHHGLVILDLHMPVMDGQTAFHAIEQFCQERRWEMPAVIFCTAFGTPDVTAAMAGNDRHTLLTKPVGIEELVNAVRSRLNPVAGGPDR